MRGVRLARQHVIRQIDYHDPSFTCLCAICARTKRTHTSHYEPICSICEPPRQLQPPPTRHAASDVPFFGGTTENKMGTKAKNGGENKCCSSCNRQPDRPANGIEERESAGRLYQHELFAPPGSSFLFRFHSRFLRPSRHRHSAVEGGQVVGLLGGDGLLPGVGQDVGHRGYSW